MEQLLQTLPADIKTALMNTKNQELLAVAAIAYLVSKDNKTRNAIIAAVVAAVALPGALPGEDTTNASN